MNALIKSVLRVGQNIYQLPAALPHVLNAGALYSSVVSRGTGDQQRWFQYLSEGKEQAA